MKVPQITKTEYLQAIQDGVYGAFYKVMTQCTDMPCLDFWDMLQKTMDEAITKSVKQALDDAFDKNEIINEMNGRVENSCVRCGEQTQSEASELCDWCDHITDKEARED